MKGLPMLLVSHFKASDEIKSNKTFRLYLFPLHLCIFHTISICSTLPVETSSIQILKHVKVVLHTVKVDIVNRLKPVQQLAQKQTNDPVKSGCKPVSPRSLYMSI